jgi:transcriptional regulator with XRE-family HTH domain
VGDDIQVGRIVRDVRLARNLRQEDVAARAGVSRGTVSRIERGLVDGMTVGSLRAVSRALEMPSVLHLGWRSPEVDRLRDRLHAAMVEQVISTLVALGWATAPEHSFNHYGERGSADILAWQAVSRSLLVVETKTRLWDLQDTLSALDRKRRLLPGLAARELGWRASAVGVVLVLPELSTHRHVVERHAATFEAALPQRQVEVRSWLASPRSNLRGLWFLPIAHQNDIGQMSRRRRASKHRRGTPQSPKPRTGRSNSGPRGGQATKSSSPPR